MVAYSYKRRFVVPIQVGLGTNEHIPGTDYVPKRQTIRADRKRHARPGEEIQHYCGMRTKACFLIGRARCVSVEPISITIDLMKPLIYVARRMVTASRIESFASADGFQDWPDMFRFWCEEHPDVVRFSGVLIKWEPLKEQQ